MCPPKICAPSFLPFFERAPKYLDMRMAVGSFVHRWMDRGNGKSDRFGYIAYSIQFRNGGGFNDDEGKVETLDECKLCYFSLGGSGKKEEVFFMCMCISDVFIS